ncbi:MAG TPA: thiaminase II [Methylomirabilota bacterium]|jgi:thiaminase/transcriptional activator TenA|nr:thiaminase II [Methylomirabilota bacterium]
MTLTERLLVVAAPIWRRSLTHPFVTELGNGTLSLEKFQFYMRQDYVFLIAYSRLLALATAKAPDLDTMGRFANLLDATLNREMALHRDFAAQCGISPEALAATQAAPTTQAYTNHLVRVAALADLPEIIAALLPCQWGYCEIGQTLARQGKPTSAPFYCQWIEMYASPEFAALAQWLRALLDSYDGRTSEQQLAATFCTSARYEYLFWEMAYHLEPWPV